MSNQQAIRLRAEALRSVDYLDLSSTYRAMGDPFENSARIIHLQNLTDVIVIYSLDGVTDHGVIAAGGFVLLDCTSNKTSDQGMYIAQGTTIYVATITGAIAPTSGDVYLSVFYGSKN